MRLPNKPEAATQAVRSRRSAVPSVAAGAELHLFNGECALDSGSSQIDLRMCPPTLGGKIACRWAHIGDGSF